MEYQLYNEFVKYNIEDVYPFDVVIDTAYRNFNKELSESIKGDLFNKADFLNTEIFEMLCQVSPDSLFISLTTSQSIFYRFSVAKFVIEFKLEVFFNRDTDNEDSVEAILHIYKSGNKAGAFYGTIKHLTSVINNHMPDNAFFEYELQMT